MPVVQVPQKIALSIAGSDPSGGAGIQADLKTFTMVGVYGGAVVSCLTVQNTKGVFAVQTIDPQLVKDQISSVLDDLDVSHIKIGMLGSASVVESTCKALRDYKGEIILDPVQFSSSGQELIDRQGYTAVRQKLLDICTVVTPNLAELATLTGMDCSRTALFLKAGEALLHEYKKLRSVIITGGHIDPAGKNVTDYLLSKSQNSESADCLEMSHTRIESNNTHGTGCTFAAAFTAFHLLTGDDSGAFRKTTRYVNALIKKSAHSTIGHGKGPLIHHLR